MKSWVLKSCPPLGVGFLFSLAWYVPQGWGICTLVLLPMAWCCFNHRWQAGLVFLMYYLASSWEMVPGVITFFAGQVSYLKILSWWLLDALMLSLPWFLFFPKPHMKRRWIILKLLSALLITVVPPLGSINWLHPLLSSGYLFPGLGLLGFLLTLILMVILAIRVRNFSKIPKVNYALLGGLLVTAVMANILYAAPLPPPNWIALNTPLGHWNILAGYQQQTTLMQRVDTALNNKALVIILPENAVGVWWPATQTL